MRLSLYSPNRWWLGVCQVALRFFNDATLFTKLIVNFVGEAAIVIAALPVGEVLRRLLPLALNWLFISRNWFVCVYVCWLVFYQRIQSGRFHLDFR